MPFNLNSTPVTVNGVTYQPATCKGGSCDPLGIGLNSQVSQLWNKYEPAPNNTNTGDAHNVEGFMGQVSLPEKTKFAVGRIDHDFGEKWRFMSSYRYFALSQLTTNQLDIGGALPATLSAPSFRVLRVRKTEFIVGGLTTNITPTLTNDFHVNFTKLWWQWATPPHHRSFPAWVARLNRWRIRQCPHPL